MRSGRGQSVSHGDQGRRKMLTAKDIALQQQRETLPPRPKDLKILAEFDARTFRLGSIVYRCVRAEILANIRERTGECVGVQDAPINRSACGPRASNVHT